MSEFRTRDIRTSRTPDGSDFSASVAWGENEFRELQISIAGANLGTGECSPEELGACAVNALLLPAMYASGRWVLDQPISPQVRYGIERQQAIFQSVYRGGVQPLEIVAPQAELGDRNGKRGVGLVFDGRIPSLVNALRGRAELTHLICISDMEGGHCEAQAQLLADRLGLSAIVARTNLFSLVEDLVDDTRTRLEGAAQASVAQLLSPVLEEVWITSENDYTVYSPSGSSPLLTRNFSSEAVRVRHVGAGLTLGERIVELKSFAEELKGIAPVICSEHRTAQEDPNCGQCETCLGIQLVMRTVGAKQLMAEQMQEELAIENLPAKYVREAARFVADHDSADGAEILQRNLELDLAKLADDIAVRGEFFFDTDAFERLWPKLQRKIVTSVAIHQTEAMMDALVQSETLREILLECLLEKDRHWLLRQLRNLTRSQRHSVRAG